MKSVTLLLKSILPLLLVLITANESWAQFPNPVCSGNGAGRVYFTSVNAATGLSEIFIMDPSTPNTAPRYTGIALPTGSTALAVGTNYGTGPNPTYYTTAVSGSFKYLYYWNGNTWVTTTAVMNTDAIGGSCGDILGLDCTSGSGFVYRWKGGQTPPSSTAPFLASVSDPGFCDIAGDCTGGFWIIHQASTPSTLRQYNAAGSLIKTYAFAGTFVAASGGLAVNGDRVYFDGTDGELYEGIINSTTSTVTFSKASTSGPFTTLKADDFGSCGLEGFCLGKGALDSVVACADTARVNLRATGPGPYNFTVASGPATITSTGPNSVQVKAWGPALITYKDADCAGVNNITDTTVIFVTKATVNAGPDDTLIGCRGYFPDTLHGVITDTTADVIYSWLWGPLDGSIISGQTERDVIIQPTTNKKFWAEVTTLNGCKFTDTVMIYVADSTPKANWTYIANFGCEEDTVRFINLTPTNVYIDFVEWNLGDTVNNNGNVFKSNQSSTTHIYKDQGIYSVLLTVSNQYCLDTFRQDVNLLHPLIADFEPDDDSACTHQLIAFDDESTTPITPPGKPAVTFFYDFGDGDTSRLANPTHTYRRAGTYRAMLAIMDYLGCTDTTYRTIVVDTIPFVTFISPDSSICEGEALNLISDYLRIGNTGTTLDLGDGTIFQNSDTTIYSFAQAGTYEVALTAQYRICPDTTVRQTVIVRPFPGVDIGPDTVICPNGQPIALVDRVNNGNPAAKYLWNTGDTTSSILAKDLGTFWARVTLDGCTASDSLLVSKDCYVDIPNSFTPNGDGVNDFFLPRQFLSRSLNTFKMSIYNRWGQVIYESSTLNGRGWDGKFNDKDQPQGVYVYVIDVSFENGVKEHYTGNVTLLR